MINKNNRTYHKNWRNIEYLEYTLYSTFKIEIPLCYCLYTVLKHCLCQKCLVVGYLGVIRLVIKITIKYKTRKKNYRRDKFL